MKATNRELVSALRGGGELLQARDRFAIQVVRLVKEVQSKVDEYERARDLIAKNTPEGVQVDEAEIESLLDEVVELSAMQLPIAEVLKTQPSAQCLLVWDWAIDYTEEGSPDS